MGLSTAICLKDFHTKLKAQSSMEILVWWLLIMEVVLGPILYLAFILNNSLCPKELDSLAHFC